MRSKIQLLMLALALTPRTAHAQPGPRLVITSAVPTQTTITIRGEGFRPNAGDAPPTVLMGVGPNGSLQPLPLSGTPTDTLAIATLPVPAPEPGSYRLFVHRAHPLRRSGKSDFRVAI